MEGKPHWWVLIGFEVFEMRTIFCSLKSFGVCIQPDEMTPVPCEMITLVPLILSTMSCVEFSSCWLPIVGPSGNGCVRDKYLLISDGMSVCYACRHSTNFLKALLHIKQNAKLPV